MRDFIFLSGTAGVLLAVFLFGLGALSVGAGERENDCAKFALWCAGK